MMRHRLLIVSAALALATTSALAQTAHEHAAAAKGTPAAQSVTGELVDMGCYLGHEARGAKHVSCATKCIMGGMPMGVLAKDGTLYLLTMNHDNADPYNQLKEMAGKTVTVSGTIMARGGMKGIDATSFKVAPEPGKK